MLLFMPALPALNSAFDLATVVLISALIILSALSLCCIFHLRFKSKSFTYLQGFNSLWTVRFLLVLFIFLWAVTELLRLPFFRRKYLYLFNHQADLCKLHIVLNLGLFQPAFLVTLLFLLNASIKKKTPAEAFTSTCLTCLPLAALHGILIFFDPLGSRVPGVFRQAAVVLAGDGTVLCAYPFLNTVVFAAFGIGYAVWFMLSCWRVLSLVINKGLRVRICALAVAVVVGLPMQVVALGFTVLWSPKDEVYGVVSMVVFLGAFCCAVTGEGILVIKPISDALAAGGNACRWVPGELKGKLPPPPPPPERADDHGAVEEGRV